MDVKILYREEVSPDGDGTTILPVAVTPASFDNICMKLSPTVNLETALIQPVGIDGNTVPDNQTLPFIDSRTKLAGFITGCHNTVDTLCYEHFPVWHETTRAVINVVMHPENMHTLVNLFGKPDNTYDDNVNIVVLTLERFANKSNRLEDWDLFKAFMEASHNACDRLFNRTIIDNADELDCIAEHVRDE